jgi:hypothetical protein
MLDDFQPQRLFNALIYTHHCRPDTFSVMVNNYLREYRQKLSAYRMHLEKFSASAKTSQRDKTKALLHPFFGKQL